MSESIKQDTLQNTTQLMSSVEQLRQSAEQQVETFNQLLQKAQRLGERPDDPSYQAGIAELTGLLAQVHAMLFAVLPDEPASDESAESPSLENSVQGLAQLLEMSRQRSQEVGELLTQAQASLARLEAAAPTTPTVSPGA